MSDPKCGDCKHCEEFKHYYCDRYVKHEKLSQDSSACSPKEGFVPRPTQEQLLDEMTADPIGTSGRAFSLPESAEDLKITNTVRCHPRRQPLPPAEVTPCPACAAKDKQIADAVRAIEANCVVECGRNPNDRCAEPTSECDCLNALRALGAEVE